MSERLPSIAWHYSEHGAGAYLHEQLAPFLAQEFSITRIGGVCEAQSYLTLFQQAAEIDLPLYSLEDSVDAYFVRMALGMAPGAVLFHDFLLATDGPEPIHNSPWEDTVASFFGERDWPRRGYSFDRKGPWASRESALAVTALFANPWARQEFKAHQQCALGSVLQGSIDQGSIWYPAAVAEQQQSADPRSVCYAGIPGVADRADSVVATMAALKDWQLTWLVKDEQELQRAREVVARHAARNVVLTVGRSPQQWQSLVSRSKVALVTRVSAFGDDAPYLEIALAQGAWTVVANFGRATSLPRYAAISIERGHSESVQLVAVLRELEGAPRCNPAATTCARELFEPRVVAGEFACFLRTALTRQQQFAPRWRRFAAAARAAVLAEGNAGWNFADPLVEQVLARPLGELFR